jgi:hypothetical protein
MKQTRNCLKKYVIPYAKIQQYYALFISVFGIRDILGRIWVLGFVHLLTDPAPAPDPDPALCVCCF